MELHVKCCFTIRVIHTAFQRAFLKPNTQTNPDKAQFHKDPGLKICSSFLMVKGSNTLHNLISTNTHTLIDTLKVYKPFFLLPSSHQTPSHRERLIKWHCSGGVIYRFNRRIQFWKPSFLTPCPKKSWQESIKIASIARFYDCIQLLYDVCSNAVWIKCLSWIQV